MDLYGSGPKDRLTGILLISGAFLLFTCLDTTAKYLSHSLPVLEIVWARSLGHLLLAGLLFLPQHGTQLVRSRRPGLQVLRSGFLLGSTFFNFVALHFLQLSTTNAIQFSTPLLIAALSVPLLGEQVGRRRWTAILVGFLGVLIIVRPGLGLMHWAVSLSLCSAVCGSLYNITTRKVAGVDPASTSAVLAPIVGVVLLSPIVPFVWLSPTHWLDWLLLCATGLFGGVGHYLLIVAHRLAPAPILAPFIYPQILYMMTAGYLVFGDIPDPWVGVGAAVVIASGLYLWYRERVLNKRGSALDPTPR
ncbi:Permease of the drug/metabolite transporter (DMT) superfamily [Tistlia consotensis]|uniref:Permease of the drug/metabolite transporter (DMT) superfamily n=1 Tax=Tistlia consotensis USBA 355 TaxID=560819 RepID=A0A1Y6CB97_9PROT|nr:DMT family transporter [Tistlia consotensis]SMF46680.1 Permease of the drug/metabolite transporter (DMT) superfamily [Tistlia consotensis USBA 355]SNR78145.1 Permease of the drug/metabolite transporter (DMT) superfamily [Tistlia consotensis]